MKLVHYFCLFLSMTSLSNCNQSLEPLPAKPTSPSLVLTENIEDHRRLPFDGAENFRDMGGYKTTDGRQVKWRLLYRSDTLLGYSTKDAVLLSALNLQKIIDFRSEDEKTPEDDSILNTLTAKTYVLPVENMNLPLGTAHKYLQSGQYNRQDLERLMKYTNRSFVEKYTLTYKAWFNGLLNESNYPMMFHSTTGKDRTGFAAALVLISIGVPKDQVLSDYMATNNYSAEKTNRTLFRMYAKSLFRSNGEGLRPLLRADRSYLEEAFLSIEEHYGSIDNYLEYGLGLDADKRNRLRDILTEEA